MGNVGRDDKAITRPNVSINVTHGKAEPPTLHKRRLNMGMVVQCADGPFFAERESHDHKVRVVCKHLACHAIIGINYGEVGHNDCSFGNAGSHVRRGVVEGHLRLV